jgi:hypothetical protein
LQRSHNVFETTIEQIDLEAEIWIDGNTEQQKDRNMVSDYPIDLETEIQRDGNTERQKHYYPIHLETSTTKIASHPTTINTSITEIELGSNKQNERDRQRDRQTDRKTDRKTYRKRKRKQSLFTEEEEIRKKSTSADVSIA